MEAEMERQRGTIEDDDDDEDNDEMEVKEEDEDDNDDSIKCETEFGSGRYFIPPPDPLNGHTSSGGGGSGGRRSRPMEEKERTKLRERHRRAITGRILAGLRRHGNYNLRVRADINEVIAALAREAGWVVMPDGTTFPSPPATAQVPRPAVVAAGSPAASQSPVHSFKGVTPAGAVRTVDHPSGRLKAVFSPPITPFDGGRCPSTVSVMAGLGQTGDKLVDDSLPVLNNNNSAHSGENKQMVVTPKVEDRCYAGTPYIPVYVMLPLDVINNRGELANPEVLLEQLQALKSINVDGVMIDCWWGIVEAHSPQVYNWEGYKQLFRIVRECKLKIQAVMSFHECGGNVGDDVSIPLPHWVTEIGKINRDIYFTDREGRRNTECLSWGIDKERVLRGRTAVEVYFDYMRSFRVEFDDFFEDGVISEVEIGLGPCGELRYPSYPAKHGWRYPGIGEFQCYDSYLLKGLREAAKTRGHPYFASGPKNAGSYNSQPHETGFFRDGGDYDSTYGRFFLAWYSKVLIDHGDLVVSLAKLVFGGSRIAVKLSGIHWWYKTASHAAELTAGFYNPSNRDGYTPIATIVKKHDAVLNFTCAELLTLDQQQDFPEALADPEGLVWQVLNVAWDASIPMASENALPCYDRDGYNRILESAKPISNPDRRHLSSFTYLRLSPILMYTHNFIEFQRFVQRMHGEWVPISR